MSSGVVNVTVVLSQDAAGNLDFEWYGTLLQGLVENTHTSDNVSIGFDIVREPGASVIKTALFLDLNVLLEEDFELELPSRLSFEVPDVPLLDGSITKFTKSCPFDALSVLPQMTIPGVSSVIEVLSAKFDVCAYLANNEQSSFVSIEGSTASRGVDIGGVSIESVSVLVEGTRNQDQQLLWSGKVAGAVSAGVGGSSVLSSAEATFDENALSSLVVSVEVDASFFTVSGEVAYSSTPCSSGNSGEVTVSFPEANNFEASTQISQKDGCGGDGKTPEWNVEFTSAQMFQLHGVRISNVAVQAHSQVASNGSVVWHGEVTGSVELGSQSGTASVVFDTENGVTSFSVAATVSIGPVSGQVNLLVEEDIMKGNGQISFAGAGNDNVPQFDASITYVNTYTPANADMPLWDIQGSLSDLNVHRLSLDSVAVQLEGRLAQSGVEWSGSVSGQASLDATVVSLTAAISNNAFSSLTGDFTINEGGLEFNGEVEVTAGDQCATVVADGGATLTSGNHQFTVSLSYDPCTSNYHMTGTAQGTLGFQGLDLTSATIDFTRQEGKWAGSLSATVSNLFGGSASASVSFADGKLDEASISTLFMTSNGILSSSVSFVYKNSCTKSIGSGTATVRLQGADELVLAGQLSYNKCTGEMGLVGSAETTWNGPGATGLSGLTFSITSSKGSGPETLSSRKWTGVINATTTVGLEASVSFETGDASSAEAMLKYEDENAMVVATIGTDCTGSGMVAVSDLPFSLPAFEASVAFSRPSCGSGTATSAWTVTGSLGDINIPFFGKTIKIQSPTVTLTSSTTGKKKVSVSGVFLGSYELELSFPLPLTKASLVKLVGKLGSGKSAQPEGFANAWQGAGSSAFPASLGKGSPGLFDGLKKVNLADNLQIEVDFGGMLALQASGTVFGLDFDILVAAKKSGNTWNYGMAFTAQGGSVSNPSGMPSVVGNVLKQLKPTYVRFGIAKSNMEALGIQLKQGLSLAAFLGSDSGVLKSVKDIAPSSIVQQISDTEGNDGTGSGLLVIANIVSTTEMNVFVQLAGNIPLGSPDVVLRELALAFVIKQGPPEFGFNVILDFQVGSGSEKQAFTASGFISLDASGSLTIELAVDSPQPWSNPFGIKGVKVLFPLGISMTITPALLPSQFSLIGGLQIGGTTGRVVIGANLADFTKTAFSAEVNNLDFKAIITDIADCSNCLGPVGNVVSDMSLEKFSGSFNPSPTSVTITIADVRADVPGGINIDIVNLKLWQVIHVERALFQVSSSGIQALFIAKPVQWGPISITSADGSSGPEFELALTPSRQLLRIDGKARILAQTVSMYLSMADSAIEGSFTYSLGSGFSVAVTINTQGRPGQRRFSNTITGVMKADFGAQLVSDATQYLKQLEDEARDDLRKANSDLQKEKQDLDDANAELASVRRTVNSRVASAQRTVDNLNDDIKNKKDKCKSKEKKCKKKPWTCGEVPKCWTEVAALETAKATANTALTAAKKAASAAISTAQGTVTAAEASVTAAQGVVNTATAVVGAFDDIVSTIGGPITKALTIHTLSFSSTLNNNAVAVSFALDFSVVGNRHNFAFSAQLSFSAVKNKVVNEFKRIMKNAYGDKIPGL